MITAIQIRMARSALDLSQSDVAEAIGIDRKTLVNAEDPSVTSSAETIGKLEGFFLSRGLEFMNNDGVRFAPSGLRIYKGKSDFRAFYDDLYETARTVGGHICLYNGVSAQVMDALGEEGVRVQKERMSKIKKHFTFDVIVQDGDATFFGADYCAYRWMPAEHFNDQTIFIFGSKVGFADFREEPTVVVIDRAEIAESMRLFFRLAWETLAREPS